MASHNPPERRALTDEELNQQVLRLQSEPDGLMRAMELIEAQAKLREEDARAFSNWELESQLEVASQQTQRDEFFPDIFPPSPEVQNQAPSEAPGQVSWDQKGEPGSIAEPEIDIFASIAPSAPRAFEPEAVEVTFPNGDFESEVSVSSKSQQSEYEPESKLESDFEAILFSAGEPEQQGVPIESSDLDPEIASVEQSEDLAASVQTETSTNEVSEIVASLNASYAQLETETDDGEVVQTYYEESVSFVSTPEPVSANLPSEQPSVSEAKPEEVSPTRKISSVVWSSLALATTPLVLLVAALLHESGAGFGASLVGLVSILFAVSGLVAVAAVAGKRSSSSLTVVSRAAFGVWGNALPAFLMLAIKIFWLAALLTVGARIITPLIFNQPWFASFASQFVFPAEFLASGIVVLALSVSSAAIAGWGGITMYRSQQIASVFSIAGLSAIAFFVITNTSMSSVAAREPISPSGLLDVSLLIFCLFGLVLFSQGADFTRKLDPQTPGSKVFFLSFVSTFFVPALAGVLGLIWFYAVEDTFGGIFLNDTLAAVAAAVPIWLFVIFTVSIGISLLQASSSGFYSIAGNLSGLGLRLPSWGTQLVVGLIVVSGSIAASYLIQVSLLLELIAEAFLLVAVPASAWVGILVSDTLLRRYGYHEVSLTRDYGFYGRFNWTNLLGFLSAIGLGYGYLSPSGGLSFWTGYLGNLTPSIFDSAGSNIGIVMSFGLALLLPIVLGIPAIRKQERGLLELESRRAELKEFLDAIE